MHGGLLLLIAAALLMAGVPLSKVVGGFIKFAFVVVLLIAALIAFAMFAFAGVNGPVVW